jgi:anti-sigma28 factor (negative regulator of flagellin synthesis)
VANILIAELGGMLMKTGTRNLGSDLQVIQNNLVVPVWHKFDQIRLEINVAPTESQVATIGKQPPAMEQALQVANSQPEERTTLIEALITQIEAGTYAVDSRAIAEKMLNLAAGDFCGPGENA